jgi:uncharacterized membrane protein
LGGVAARWILGETITVEKIFGETSGSQAIDVSSDGTAVAGQIYGDQNARAVHWDTENGLTYVDTDATWGLNNQSVTAMSSDGSTIVGSANGNGLSNTAFRWTAVTGMVDLRTGSNWATGTVNSETSAVVGVSADGKAVAGYAYDGGNVRRAFYWHADDQKMVDIAATSNGWALGINTDYGQNNNSRANAISADGSTVVGYAFDAKRGFRWTEATGMLNLERTVFDNGTTADWGTLNTNANAVSADGSVVVGQAYSATDGLNQAFRWHESTGLVNLATGSDFEDYESSADFVSADGKVIVGYVSGVPDPVSEAENDLVFIYGIPVRPETNGVMLDAVNTQKGVVQSAAHQGDAIASVTAALASAVETELFIAPSKATVNDFVVSTSGVAPRKPMVFSISASQSSNDDTGNLKLASLSAAIGVSQQITAGGFLAAGDDGTNLSGFGFDGILTSFGGFVRGVPLGETGLTWKASLAQSIGDVTINRDAILTGTEAGQGFSAIRSFASSFELGYQMKSGTSSTTPFVRATQTSSTRNAYQEKTDVSFPISYAESTETVTTATFGVDHKSAITRRTTLRIVLGAEMDLGRSNTEIMGTSSIPGLTDFSVAAPEIVNNSRTYFNAGVTHQLQEGAAIRCDITVVQSAYSNNVTKSGRIAYQWQF